MKFHLFSLILLIALALVGVVPLAAQEGPAGFPMTVTDMNGRELMFDAPPQRVICLLNRCAQELAFIGIAPVAVGAPYTYNVARDPLNFGELAETFGPIPQTDGVDLELIASYEPDLIIGEADIADAVADIAPLYSYSWDASVWQDFDNFTTDVRNFGSIFGMEAEVDAKIKSVQDRVAAYAALSPNDRSHLVFFFNDDMGASLWVPGDCGLFLSQLSPCGNPNGGNWIEGTIETLLSFDPDVLIVEQYSVDDEAAMLENLNTSNLLWNELTAVQNGDVYLVPVSQARTNTIQSVKGAVDALMPLIYPDVFPAPLTDEQVQDILAGETGTSDAQFPVTVMDGYGNEVTFDAPPQRMVCIAVHCISTLAFIGERPEAVVDYPNGANNIVNDPRYYADTSEEVTFIPTESGFNLDYEAILAFQPDFVLVNNEDQFAALSGFVPVYIQSQASDTLDVFVYDVRNVARIFGKEAEAEVQIDALVQRVEAYAMASGRAKSIYYGFPSDDRGSSFWLQQGGIVCYVAPEEQCGGSLAENWAEYTIEGLLGLEPDVLIIEDIGGVEAAVVASLADNPLWQELSVVQNDQVFVLSRTTSAPRPVTPLAFQIWLDTVMPTLYPEVFPDGPLTDEQVREILAEAEGQ